MPFRCRYNRIERGHSGTAKAWVKDEGTLTIKPSIMLLGPVIYTTLGCHVAPGMAVRGLHGGPKIVFIGDAEQSFLHKRADCSYV